MLTLNDNLTTWFLNTDSINIPEILAEFCYAHHVEIIEIIYDAYDDCQGFTAKWQGLPWSLVYTYSHANFRLRVHPNKVALINNWSEVFKVLKTIQFQNNHSTHAFS